jgi:DnaJ-class molecular chaperone
LILSVLSCAGFTRSTDRCKACGGTGKDTYMTSDYHVYSRVCPVCAGIGKEIK